MLKLKVVALATLALLCGLAVGAGLEGRRTYIVQLGDAPAVTYQGGVAGLAATQPAPGTRFDARTLDAQAYIGYLDAQQRAVAASVAGAPVLANYHAVFNGFAAQLTPADVNALRANAKVVQIFEDQPRELDTISTPTFLGLTAPGGLWSQLDALSRAVKGEDMVIGVVDGGIWPENTSFADRVDGSGVPTFSGGTLAYGPPPATFTGGCVAGEGFNPATHCNNKLVGAKFYNAGFLAASLPKNWSEFYSPRDSVGGVLAHGGHGDHTASTAAGNSLAPVVMTGISFGPASGMAPRARVAAYKVCWTYDDPTATDGTGSKNSCFTSDSVKAIDDAVKDGVNVINYSISGSLTSVNDPVEQAFYRATVAGVFVAASAGNSGPANQVAHISPWLTTVAASTHNRILRADVTLGDGAKYTGASMNITPLPSTPLIRAEDAGMAGADPTKVTLCYSAGSNLGVAVLDPVKVAGKIVICTRGTTARVDKSLAVAQAGGVGMIMRDNGAGLVAEVHSVPTVHVTSADGLAIQTYAASLAGTSDMGTFRASTTANAPVMADFSSRGPNQGDSNVLKPDLTAPGVDVIAAVTPALTVSQRDAVANGTLVPDPDWASYQGTSMSSPHVAGLALLLKQAHPTWSPAAIKSALMTTTYSTLNDGLPGAQNGLLPWAQGAGHVDPNEAIDPGLVYDAGKADFVKYQCKVNRTAVSASDCATYGTLDETYNLNLPSITAGTVVGNVTVTRNVTNVGGSSATYTASASVSGFSTVVTPASLDACSGGNQKLHGEADCYQRHRRYLAVRRADLVRWFAHGAQPRASACGQGHYGACGSDCQYDFGHSSHHPQNGVCRSYGQRQGRSEGCHPGGSRDLEPEFRDRISDTQVDLHGRGRYRQRQGPQRDHPGRHRRHALCPAQPGHRQSGCGRLRPDDSGARWHLDLLGQRWLQRGGADREPRSGRLQGVRGVLRDGIERAVDLPAFELDRDDGGHGRQFQCPAAEHRLLRRNVDRRLVLVGAGSGQALLGRRAVQGPERSGPGHDGFARRDQLIARRGAGGGGRRRPRA